MSTVAFCSGGQLLLRNRQSHVARRACTAAPQLIPRRRLRACARSASAPHALRDATSASHVPVLLTEVIETFRGQTLPIFVDCTLGAGGHARALLDAASIGEYIGIDKDATALTTASATLSPYRISLAHADFRDVRNVLQGRLIDGALVDLGVSSMQLDEAERGFSFMRDGPLDMRMDARARRTAADIVASATEDELQHLFRVYADDTRARANARAVVTARMKAPIRTTKQLADAISPPGAPRGRTHPATLPFQALRIAVNGEIDAVEELLPPLLDALRPGAKLCVIAFHSIEDRVVKNAFRDAEIVGGVDVLTRRPVVPGDGEVRANARSRSAKLRIVRKLAPGETPSRFKRNKYRDR